MKTTRLFFLAGTNFSRTFDNQLQSPFLSLPAELRNSIYEAAFCGGIARFHPVHSETNIHAKRIVGELSLRAACRQTRYESNFLFYRHYVFDISRIDLLSMPRIVEFIGLDNCLFIERIVISFNMAFSMIVQVDPHRFRHRQLFTVLFPRLEHVYIKEMRSLVLCCFRICRRMLCNLRLTGRNSRFTRVVGDRKQGWPCTVLWLMTGCLGHVLIFASHYRISSQSRLKSLSGLA